MSPGLSLPRNYLHPRQSSACITCPAPPPCNCAQGEQCFQINRDCYTCSSFKCVSSTTGSSSSSSSISKGALAGAIVGVLVFLACVVYLGLRYRRRWSGRTKPATEAKDVPAPAAAVLSRPDPIEKLASAVADDAISSIAATEGGHGPGDIGAAAAAYTTAPQRLSRQSSQSNPFTDGHSIQTTSTSSQGTNVIPIALVPPASIVESFSSTSVAGGTTSSEGGPARPPRSPDLDLNLEQVNVSRNGVRAMTSYAAHSVRSGISVASSRQSYMSNASYSSEFLEAPVIVTPNQGAVRQVLGVHKAEMLQAPPSQPGTPTGSESVKSQSIISRPSVRSPLAATSFTPADIVKEVDGEGDDTRSANDPFGDDRSNLSSAPTAATFGLPSPRLADLSQSPAPSANQSVPSVWNRFTHTGSHRSSLDTQAGSFIGSVIDIGSATRVNVGLASSPAAEGVRPSPTTYRTTMGKLVTPPSSNNPKSFANQQHNVLANPPFQGELRRVSGSSVLSATSTRADSILESFPFVPPSPISDRPARSPPPPRSPLAAEAPISGSAPAESVEQPQEETGVDAAEVSSFARKTRKTAGLSTFSQFSTASSGLGDFPFQLDNLIDGPPPLPPPSSLPRPPEGRQRASLDTLALTSDLASYPLGFDKEAKDNYPLKHKV